MVYRVEDNEKARTTIFSIKPQKILPAFLNSWTNAFDEKDLKTITQSTIISALMIYFIKNIKNKKFLKEIIEIIKDINFREVKI